MRLNVFFFCLLCFACTSQAEIYKWRDERGVMHYADTPPPVGARATEKLGGKGKADWPLTRADSLRKEEMATAVAGKPRVENEPAMKPAESAALKMAEDRLKSQNCAAARTNYRQYAVGGRMQTVTESGEKAYLTDEEIRDGMARAQQEIEDNCPQESATP